MRRSIKESMNDAAFRFVKEGFEEKPKLAEVPPPAKPKAEIPPAKPKAADEAPAKRRKPKPKPEPAPAATVEHLLPLSTRMRASLLADLKKEGLRRQLAEKSPHTLQDILAEAAEEWLRKNRTE